MGPAWNWDMDKHKALRMQSSTPEIKHYSNKKKAKILISRAQVLLIDATSRSWMIFQYTEGEELITRLAPLQIPSR